VRADLGFGFAHRADGPALVADEEALPFAPRSFDLVLSAMSLHWVNDLPGALIQIARILKPDGLLLGAMLGGGTLWQLRQALAAAESEVEGGLSPRVSPFAELHDAAGLLQRAGFALPVADSETIEVDYESALALMRDLGAMGESNLVAERRRSFSRRATLLRAAEIYGERFALPSGRVAASFEVLFLHGWAPHPAQPKAMKAGQRRPSAGRGARHGRDQRRRKGGTLDAPDRRGNPVRELRLLLCPPRPVLPSRHHSVDPVAGAAHPGRRRDEHSLMAVLIEKAIDVIPTTMFVVGVDAAGAARSGAHRALAGARLVAARDRLPGAPDPGRRHHLRPDRRLHPDPRNDRSRHARQGAGRS
jgi:hypothetical protein